METRDNTGKLDKRILLKYLKGELPPGEAWKVEKAMLDDPFLAEAMEGLEAAYKEGTLEEDLEDLGRTIQVRTEKTSKITGFTYLRAAAVLLLLAVVTYVVVEFAYRSSPRNELAVQKTARPDTAASAAYNESGKAIPAEKVNPAAPVNDQPKPRNVIKFTPPVVKKDEEQKMESNAAKATEKEDLSRSGQLANAESGAGQARPEIADLEKKSTGPEGTGVKTEISLPASREVNEKPSVTSMADELSGQNDNSVRALGAGKTDQIHVKLSRALEGPAEYSEPRPSIGDSLYRQAIESSLRYPEEARKRNIQGEVIVQFTVKADSTISSAHVVSGLGAGCDEEAIRLILNGSKWVPAVSFGKPVNSVVNYNILFKIKN